MRLHLLGPGELFSNHSEPLHIIRHFDKDKRPGVVVEAAVASDERT